MTTMIEAEEAIRRTCDRCACGDAAYREGGEWVHGVDKRGEVYINPQPCAATALHDLLSEIEEFPGRTLRQIEPREDEA